LSGLQRCTAGNSILVILHKLSSAVGYGRSNINNILLIVNMAVVFQYFADRDVFCAGRVPEEDLQRVASATGGSVQTSVNNIVPEVGTYKFTE
jgi:T-complex protein 1 subunit eta